ncbi:ABC transporter permease [Limnochorda pilosa]|uniref:ABC transporter permease n=1 Tax=Limnochorda pilosa TaxID=1555112 RepID=A0A0K2SHJ3_LIMPI|nr:ABC transporter permease [Limnochorda pilosa]
MVHPEPLWRVRMRLWRKGLGGTWEAFWESRLGPIGLGLILFFILLAASYPLLMRFYWNPMVYDPVTGFDFEVFTHPSEPSLRHWLGTDPYGRDVFSQLAYSTSREFALGLLAAVVTVVIGTMVGTAAAYYGGFTDTFFMRLADLFLLFPAIPILIVVSSAWPLDVLQLAIVLGVLGGFGPITIVLKSQALSVGVRPYIDAARVAGGSDFHILRTHIIPNVMPISFLYMMFNVTGAIASEATLSFFGLLNVRMSWGLMIDTANTGGYLLDFAHYWWLWAPSGLAITLFCAAFYLVGRGLETVFNPRLRKR